MKTFLNVVFASFVVISIIGVTSCKKTDEPGPTPEPQPATYTIKGQVLHQETNQPVAGVLVTMGTLTQTTNTTGNFQFTGLAQAGKYTLVFTKDDYFSSTYSIEFAQAGPNHTVVYTLTATLVPYVEGVTPLNPVNGGSINVSGTGETVTTLTIPSGTTVTDNSGQPVTGSINITAVTERDIVVNPPTHAPALGVYRFEPSGLQFSNPLTLLVDNPVPGYRHNNVRLEFYNETNNTWEIQSQTVSHITSGNDYSTTINHFSLYKIGYQIITTETSAEEEIEVPDSVIRNFSLVNLPVTKITYNSMSGTVLDEPIATSLSELGITGEDATALTKLIEEALKDVFNGALPTSQYTVSSKDLAVNRTILPGYKLLTTGVQNMVTKTISFVLVKLSTSSLVTVSIKATSAGMVTLSFQDKIFDEHDHGMGGGGSN
ncbi:MAG: carboxypeptidase regulatory-like domain-containing protein [Bacteroidales bacterium]|nr:carboxypeptidase regulatory-like domain-containing protein [Bacteroidales bacterium]MDD2424495.1 carboxypeptidase regulatory-like domain-containing protein [Bacteroidales bacterium]MDD3988523.1 carboxypeptidase regulatory-like domain-containing protein [Bacteroidales bacterium]MDD4638210.1 carboxypeptidase regulatory-like domain-containing protein [Bacteroidales bacterium]